MEPLQGYVFDFSAKLCTEGSVVLIFSLEENLPPNIFYPARLSLQIKGEIKDFSNKKTERTSNAIPTQNKY